MGLNPAHTYFMRCFDMLHVFDFNLLRGATEDSHVKVIQDGVELSVFAIRTNNDGDVEIILADKGGEC